MSKPYIIINVHGGLVQEVYCDMPLADLVVVDWDVDGGDGGVTEARRGNETLRAYVTHPVVEPLHHLAGSDVEAVIEAAAAEESLDNAVV